ncbi:MAG: BTAD domain-containing putative transcriptional regulator, partial [Actinomycetota bacterium]
GEHEAVMPLLEADLAEHPLRERLTELVMLALYRNGRQSEALEVCRRLRAELVNRLGIDPGPAIQKLEEQILNHDIALRPPASATTTIGRRLDQGREDAGDDPTAGAGSASVVRLEEGPVVRRLVAALRAGRGLTVAVTGEPGSGKTVLTAGLADAVGRAMGRGNDSRSAADAASKAPGRGHDERPAAEAADPPVRPAAPVVVAVARSRSVAADEQMWLWSQVLDRLPEPPAAIAPGSPPPTAIRMGDVVDRIRSLTARQPVLIVLEDCHWADAPSIETLLHVTEELAQQPVGLIVTWRPTERARPEVLQSLRRLARIPTLARVELGGLDPDAIEVLLANRSVGRGPAARLAGGDAIGSGGGSLARRLHQVTAGNPSFVSELLAGLGDRDGVIDLDRGLPLTTNLRELVRERVDGVDPRAFEVLSLAAVVDGPFSPELMAEAGDLAPDLVDQVLERAATGGLVSAAGPGQQDYRFVHPVVADVLRDDVSGPRRARLHARLRLAAYGGATGDDGRQTVDPIASQPIPNQAPAP